MSDTLSVTRALQQLAIQKCVHGVGTYDVCQEMDELLLQYKIQQTLPFCISINKEVDYVSPSYSSQNKRITAGDVVRIHFGIMSHG